MVAFLSILEDYGLKSCCFGEECGRNGEGNVATELQKGLNIL